MNDRPSFRRDHFLKLVGAGTSGGFVIPGLFNLFGMRLPDSIPLEQAPKPDLIHGIPVYGARSPIRDTQVLQAIAEREEKRISDRFARLYAAGDRDGIVDLRGQTFAPHSRRLEVIVPNTVYHNPDLLTRDGKYPYDFVRWYLHQLAALEQIVQGAAQQRSLIPYQDDLAQFSLDIARMEVVDEKLYRETGRNPYQDPVWASDQFSRWGFDIDNRHILSLDHLALIRKGRTWESAFKLADEREVKIDSGLLAGLLVTLLGAENLFPYEVEVMNEKDYAPLISIYEPYRGDMLSRFDQHQISPATLPLIEAAIDRVRMRSIYTTNAKQHEQLGLPPRATFSFSLNGQPILVRRLTTPRGIGDEQYIAQAVEGVGEQVSSHGYRLDRSQYGNAYPFLIANLSLGDEKIFHMPLPQLILKTAHRGGETEPRFDITLTEKVHNPERFITLNVISTEELGEYSRRSGRVFASAPIPGTDTVHIWEWKRDPELDARDFAALLPCLLLSGLAGSAILSYILERKD